MYSWQVTLLHVVAALLEGEDLNVAALADALQQLANLSTQLASMSLQMGGTTRGVALCVGGRRTSVPDESYLLMCLCA